MMREFYRDIKLDSSGRLIVTSTASSVGSMSIDSQKEFYENIKLESNGEVIVEKRTGTGTITINSQKEFYENIKLSTDGYLIWSDSTDSGLTASIDSQYDYFSNVELTSEGYLKSSNTSGTISGTQNVDSYYNFFKLISLTTGGITRLIGAFSVLDVNGLQLYLNKSTNVNSKIAAKFTAANNEYLSSTSTDFSKDGTTSFSMGCWFKSTTTNAGGSIFMAKDEVGSRGYLLYLKNTTRNLTMSISTDGSSIPTISDTTATSLNVWYFAVFVYDSVNNLAKISLNGVDFTTLSVASIYNSTAPFTISSNIPINDFGGLIDSPFFYDKALSLAEVKSLYNSGNGTDYSTLINHNGDLKAIGQRLNSTDVSYLQSTSTDFKVGNEDFSFGCWVKSDNNNVNRIIGRYTTTGNRSYIIYKDATNFNIQLSNDGTSVITTAGSTYTAGNWYFVVGVYDSVNDLQKISVNGGAFITTSNTTGVFNGGTANFEVSNSDSLQLDGVVDSTFFYNKALSLAEIQALYNSGNGKSSSDLTTSEKINLISYWDMNNIEGENQIDSIGTNDLTPVNLPLSTSGIVNDTTISTIESSLVEWWRLNEESGERFGELGHTLTDNNTVTYDIGKVEEKTIITNNVADFIAANSEYLSSSSGYFTMSDEDFSFGCWFKSTNVLTQQFLINKYAGATNYSYMSRILSGFINIQLSSDGTVSNLTSLVSTIPLSNNTWHFYTVVYDSINNLMKISVDGNNFESKSHSGGAFTGSIRDFIIGYEVSSLDFNGQIDSPFFYNKALSITEIQDLYDRRHLKYRDLTTAQKTNLVSYWDLDEKSGTRYDAHSSNDLIDNNTVGYGTFRYGRVYNWIDQSPNSFIFKQDVLTKQMILEDDGIISDGVDDYLIYSAAQPLNDSSGTMFFSFISDGVNFTNIISSMDNASNNSFIAFQETTGFVIRMILNDGTLTNSIQSTDTTVIGYNYGYIRSTGTSYEISLNGVLQTIVVVIGSDDGKWFVDVPNKDNLVIASGQRLSPFYSISKLDKLIYSNANLTAGEISDINSFMSNPNN